MLKKQFREFIKLLGLEQENLTEETLDYLVEQMQKILEFDNIQNTISFKTGCILHQLLLKNQKEIREALEEQLRKKFITSESLPRFKFGWNRICLNLEEDYNCKVLKQMNSQEPKCKYLKNVQDCEIVQESVSVFENWT
ncbi:MAG: hypothetical protein HeimC3_02400 [Candidatus Heimdallarchaeota archaeon LC_3]|nr:MAG: hypothetical protein HeimC3_02400 [Candidatus Heimdallarchaeota archaeon LC_3]